MITPEPGDLGIFFDQAGTVVRRSGVTAFVPFDFYVLSFDIPGGMLGYEFAVQIPAGMIISGGRQLPAGALDTGVGDDNWIVATGGACVGAAGPYAAVSYPGALFLASPLSDTSICLGGAAPSRFANGQPGYVACDPLGALQPFGAAYAGCAIVNPSVSWPCNPPLYSVSIEIGTGATTGGLAISLPVRYVPDYPICISKGTAADYRIAHAEIDFVWDPAVATLVGARWPGSPTAAPVLDLTLDSGTATVVLDRPAGICSIYSDTQLLWLDFVAAPRPGQTAVTATRARLVLDDGADLQPTAQFSAGSIVVGPVANEVESFGAWKTRWAGRP